MSKRSFAQKVADFGAPPLATHALSSAHIRELSLVGLEHPEAISPKAVHELCRAVVDRNREDDAAEKQSN